MSAYKTSEKRWKQMTPTAIADDCQLIDVLRLTPDQQQRVREVGRWKWPMNQSHATHTTSQPILAFDGFGDQHKGFFIIPNAFDAKTQLQIANACLTEYAEPPHVTNMHLQNEQVTDIWHKARQSRPQNPCKSPQLSKLHWAACGYHYEWTSRKYFKESFSPVPRLLEQIAVQCSEACGMTIAAEAVIVNFYKKNSTMGGHQDDVEYTYDHPVISLSLGSTSIFLKGGLTKDEQPLEVVLRSGDLAVLGGNSRLSYHGVARVLPTPFHIAEHDWEELIQETTKSASGRTRLSMEEDYEAVRQYLSTQRININIRQVYPLTDKESAKEIGC